MNVNFGHGLVASDDGGTSNLVELFTEVRDVKVGTFDTDVGAVAPGFFFGDVEGGCIDDDATVAHKIFDAGRIHIHRSFAFASQVLGHAQEHDGESESTGIDDASFLQDV